MNVARSTSTLTASSAVTAAVPVPNFFPTARKLTAGPCSIITMSRVTEIAGRVSRAEMTSRGNASTTAGRHACGRVDTPGGPYV